jgi:hypothetical protein
LSLIAFSVVPGLFQLRRAGNVASWFLTVNYFGTTQEQQQIDGLLLAGGTA